MAHNISPKNGRNYSNNVSYGFSMISAGTQLRLTVSAARTTNIGYRTTFTDAGVGIGSKGIQKFGKKGH